MGVQLLSRILGVVVLLLLLPGGYIGVITAAALLDKLMMLRARDIRSRLVMLLKLGHLTSKVRIVLMADTVLAKLAP